jgi:hypothetical protein
MNHQTKSGQLSRKLPLAISILLISFVTSLFMFITTGSCFLPCAIPATINNYQLYRFKRHLYDYPLPPKTLVSDQQAQVGLFGNGNHCDYVAELTLVSELSRQEIEDYYSDVVFPPAREYRQVLEGQYELDSSYVKPDIVLIGLSDNGKYLYKVSISDGGYDPGLDFRCH